VREGLAYLAAHRPQAAVTLVKTLWGAGGGMIFLFAVYAAEVFAPRGGDASRALGLLYAGRGVGALAGPLVFRRLWGESAHSLQRSILAGFLLAAAGYAAMIAAPTALAGSLFLVVAHAGGSTCWVCSTQLLQITVPNSLQGRVFAVEIAGLTLSMALSSGLAGALVGRGLLDLRATTLLLASVPLAGALIWWAAMRRLSAGLAAAARSPESSPIS
jgi:hypothetical protein